METLAPDNVVYEFGKFALDPGQRTLFADGVPMHLPAKEFDTLLLFVENNRKALKKEEMMTRIWQDSFVEEVNLAKQISRLRKMLNADGGSYIETLPKHGYRFSADLRWTAKTIDQPMIIEKRTVKRLTMSVEGRAEREVSTNTSARRLRFGWLIAALPILAVVGLGYFAVSYNRNNVAAVHSREPVRLTDSPYHDTGPSWTRDGRIRFHRIYSKDLHGTLIMNADGSGQSGLAAADNKRIFSWSPDERKVLFHRKGDMTKIYLANADGTGETLLPFGGGNWSPDSRMLTYHARVAEQNFDIFVYSTETGEIRNLTNNEAFDADPSFSPDGTRIVFASGLDRNAEIYSIALDGGGDLRRLTFDPATDSHAAYSPDGTAILFTSDRENENADVYIMNANGGDPVKLTAFDKSNETAGPGSWSPDGTRIAFFSDRNGKDDIYVTSAETVRPKVVLSDPKKDLHAPAFSPDGESVVYNAKSEDKTGELRIFDFYTSRTRLVRKTELPATTPMWSPDGGRIAFVDRIDGNSEVCAVNADGSGFANLSNDPSLDISPSWSPDGARLIFTSHRGEPSVGQLYTMNADGSDPRPLTPKKGWEGDAVWSPDGGIVFVCDRADSPGNVLDICRINADGSGEKRILSNRDHDTQPAVSPDGTRIAFVALSDGNAEIYIMNSDGSGLLRLTRDPADDLSPNWSPDGRKLLFTSTRTGRSAIYEIEVPH